MVVVVSTSALYPDDPSSVPADSFSIFVL